MATFGERIVGAALLNVHTYEEVEADQQATGQAMGVVVLAGLAQGIGSLTMGGSAGFVVGALGALLGWFVWAFLIYLIGTRVLPESGTRADLGELLRTIGFSASPGLLRVLGVLPVLGGLILLTLNIWMLIAMIIAVRQALDYTSTGRAVGVCVIGWLAQAVVLALFITAFGLRPA